jgi:drug/metabolite transporter (DMT)-like permease
LTRNSGLALMVAAPVLWSTAGVVTRHVESAAPFELVFWRSLFCLVFMLVAMAVLRMRPRLQWPVLASGVLWAVMFTAFMIALTLTTTANTLVVMAVSPLLTTLLAAAFLRDPLPASTWVAAGAAGLGIAWMFASDFAAHTRADLLGMLIAFSIPVASAVNVVVLRSAGARVDLRPALAIGGLISLLLALPLAFPFQATGKDVALLAFLGVFQLALPCLLLILASRVLLAPEMALIGLLEVVLGPLWAWLGAGEVPAQATLAGGAIVLGALVLNEAFSFRRLSGDRG